MDESESDGVILASMGTDAQAWAEEFCNRFGIYADDGVIQDKEGLMISWFANAIEAGRSAGEESRHG